MSVLHDGKFNLKWVKFYHITLLKVTHNRILFNPLSANTTKCSNTLNNLSARADKLLECV